MADTPTSTQEQREREAEAEVVAKHLPEGYSAAPDAMWSESTGDASSSAPELSQPGEESSLKLLGGDMHRDIYKISARAKMHKRAATFAAPSGQRGPFPGLENEISAQEQLAPGGFRRQYVQSKLSQVTSPVTKNFISFLDLYGSFAGEDLGESDDEDDSTFDDEDSIRGRQSDERRPLLGRRKSSKAARREGDAGMTKTFFTLLKAFIGTGIMFLPKAFKNGGILFSSITLITVSLISTLAFHLLLSCRSHFGGAGYGDLGEAISGSKFRKLILFSIFISQIGFVCAGIIFTAENLYSFALAVSPPPRNENEPISTKALIGLQLVILVPLALIRNISKLGPAALFADVFIFMGLIYIWTYDIKTIAAHGISRSVELFNPRDFTLTVGSAIFTFEGIGLILPIQSSMREPAKFSRLLYLVMLIITVIFTSIGALSYATFGDQTRTEVISNFPQDSKLVNAIQFLYSMAVLIGTPVQLFPAVRIVETKLFGERSGKRSTGTKWKKNVFRTALIGVCAVVSILGAGDLDKFVALIGSFACVPLVYIYPAYLHYKGVAEKRWVKIGDIILMVVGVVAMVYTTAITLVRWSQS
ncbi:hypothetical protein K402DRAFT_450189 [Aulographum hederae CBS 113979]|uniref:Amino acid transporter transmembrane domain-containing protein n=1 Tax=Aulographum hederae CBS 113979 TaxID=1176131 RepID=A0A6G1HFQ3_9PEZI|nr:hypothetical protein K402DRAFT_450189 [Aulographum hederae CBS 113979]